MNNLHVIWFQGIQEPYYQQALQLRKDVFVFEQNVPLALEIDGLDPICRHLLLYKDEQPIGTARLLKKEKNREQIQRVAILAEERGKGYGTYLMRVIHEEAKGKKITSLELSAQERAVPFYENLGYEKLPQEAYIDAGILHYDMSLDLLA